MIFRHRIILYEPQQIFGASKDSFICYGTTIHFFSDILIGLTRLFHLSRRDAIDLMRWKLEKNNETLA